MIRQYLSNTNESATIPILQNVLELNKAQFGLPTIFTSHPLVFFFRINPPRLTRRFPNPPSPPRFSRSLQLSSPLQLVSQNRQPPARPLAPLPRRHSPAGRDASLPEELTALGRFLPPLAPAVPRSGRRGPKLAPPRRFEPFLGFGQAGHRSHRPARGVMCGGSEHGRDRVVSAQ